MRARVVRRRSTDSTPLRGARAIEVSLEGFHPGAVVTATLPDGRRLVEEAHAGSSYLSSEDPRLHFGLGPATKLASLTVRFPDGSRTRLANVAANQIITVKPPLELIRAPRTANVIAERTER